MNGKKLILIFLAYEKVQNDLFNWNGKMLALFRQETYVVEFI